MKQNIGTKEIIDGGSGFNANKGNISKFESENPDTDYVEELGSASKYDLELDHNL